jgi:hypothetical protein
VIRAALKSLLLLAFMSVALAQVNYYKDQNGEILAQIAQTRDKEENKINLMLYVNSIVHRDKVVYAWLAFVFPTGSAKRYYVAFDCEGKRTQILQIQDESQDGSRGRTKSTELSPQRWVAALPGTVESIMVLDVCNPTRLQGSASGG